MFWHEQKWTDIQKLDRDTPVIIPLGSCEQHGHHLPLFVDSIQVDALATGVERRLGSKALVLPTLWLGCSHHHLDFPGTISVRPSVYAEMIKDIASSILQVGFKRLFFLNGHGGNDVPGSHALGELILDNEAADGAFLIFTSWWQIGKPVMTAEQHGMATPGLSHACEYETSFVLALRPDLVDMSKVGAPEPWLARPWVDEKWNGLVKGFNRFHRFTAKGGLGDASQATAEKGASLRQAVEDQIVDFIEDMSQWSATTKMGPQLP